MQFYVEKLPCDIHNYLVRNDKTNGKYVWLRMDRLRIDYTISEPAQVEILRHLAILNKQHWQGDQDNG